MHNNKDSPSMTKNVNTEDIIQYLYQHTIYDEIPGSPQNKLHDHNAIYCHETDYIGHGIYMKTCPKQWNYLMTLKCHKVKHS